MVVSRCVFVGTSYVDSISPGAIIGDHPIPPRALLRAYQAVLYPSDVVAPGVPATKTVEPINCGPVSHGMLCIAPPI